MAVPLDVVVATEAVREAAKAAEVEVVVEAAVPHAAADAMETAINHVADLVTIIAKVLVGPNQQMDVAALVMAHVDLDVPELVPIFAILR